MLDVLELHAIRPPDEERQRVGCVDDVGDLESPLLRSRDLRLDRVNQHTDVVQERPLGIAGLAPLQLDERATHLEPVLAGSGQPE